MTTTDRILDWATISAAGIDTDRVERVTNSQDTSLEQYEIVSRDGTEKLMFGEYWDSEEGGYDLGIYEQVGTAAEPRWEMRGAPSYAEDPAEILAEVAEWLAGN